MPFKSPFNSKNIDPFWVLGGLTVAVWVFCFRVFLTREAPVLSDAVSFYDHLKFYIDNISRGVYPLWDPLWSCGSPNEFFLRRIGPFNPLLLLIIIPYKLGVNYWFLFASFITLYFFLGMFGFYKLALEVLKDKRSAMLAFVLLSLSSLGTRVFDSYIMMFMTPMIWFFYFLLVFGRTGQKYALAGLVFCVMLLMTTYIPFYFIVLALTFGLFFIPIFPKETLVFFLSLLRFVRQNPFFFLLCLIALGASCVPGVMFFKNASDGTFAMPLRHFDAAAQNVLSVKSDVTTYWAIPEDLLYSLFYLEDLRFFDNAVFYVPIISVIFLFAGIAMPLNRKVVFIFSWASFLFFIGSPYLVPLYNFLNQHIFLFKYFRNLHFFLWLGILPLFILFVVEQLRLFVGMLNTNIRNRKVITLFIVLLHVGLAALLIGRDSYNISTWIVLGASLWIFLLYLWGKLSAGMFYGLCFLVIMIEPVEAYTHLSHNALKYVSLSEYDQFSPNFQYMRGKRTDRSIAPEKQPTQPQTRSNPLYFGTQWYNLLWDNMDFPVLRNYIFSKFILYDDVAGFDEQKQGLGIVEYTWKNQVNLAYVPPPELTGPLARFQQRHAPSNIVVIENDTDQFRVIHNDVNSVKIATSFPVDKFLVFNDGYYPGWHAYSDGKEIPLYRANVAFKGILLPAGRHMIEFRFGEGSRYWGEFFLLIFYPAFFSYFIWLYSRRKGEHV